jgi:heat-inducible transcriptional repressor
MLSDRAAFILSLLVQQYIKTGHPVGSKVLAESPIVACSAATVRNVLAELESQGLLSSPHTSAGRVPTDAGLRYFIDHLARWDLADDSLGQIKQRLGDQVVPAEALIESVSDVLSSLSSWVGLVTVPRPEANVLRHVEFLPLHDNRMLVVLVVNESEVHNRIIEVPSAYNESELKQVGQFLTEHFAGKELARIREELISAMKAHQVEADRIMRTAISLADKAFEHRASDEMVIKGEANLLSLSQEGGLAINELQDLFRVFKEKHQMLSMLDECLDGEGVQIFIGQESGFEPLKHCSIVTSRYTLGDHRIGVLGVIRPTRMAYDRVVPMVEGTARLLSHALNSSETSPDT